MLACVTVLALIGYAAGHAAMFWPPNWQDENGLLGLKSGQHYGSDYIAAYNWLMNHTTIKGEQTIDESMRTMKEAEGVWLKNNTPWLSPGSAYVTSPCGVLTIPRCLGTRCHDGAGGVSHRLSAEDFDFPNVVTTQWTIGSKVEVFWGVAANHGGGYLYRLCKVPKEGVSGITEECFQRTPLRFVGEKQWFQFGEDVSSRIYFLANRTDVGTKPAGSQWTKNPIPGCTVNHNGFYDKTPGCPKGTHFEPIIPEAAGYGSSADDSSNMYFNFTVGDNIQIPDYLEPGKYVLSWRMDCEETPQVWNSCASINLVTYNYNMLIM